MNKVILFGAGEGCKRLLKTITGDIQIVGIADNAYTDKLTLYGHLVINPKKIMEYEFDEIIITLDDLKEGNDKAILDIYNQLIELGINDRKILLQSIKYREKSNFHKPRTDFIYQLSEYFTNIGLEGSVAECGVYRGWFSGILSDVFATQKMYLFDSFEGFSISDLEGEEEKAKNWVECGAQKRLSNTSAEIVKLRIRNRERLIIRKGFVPQTLEGINDNFIFVNLDMDLYTPQFEALNWFASRMLSGG